jgi:hypothetical protein
MHSCKGRFIVVAVGVVAMALASRREDGWRSPPPANIVYRVHRRDRGWVRVAKDRYRRNIVIKNFSRTKNTTLPHNNKVISKIVKFLWKAMV